jgi:hypothetical protein
MKGRNRPWFVWQFADHPLYPVFQKLHVEVDEATQTGVRQRHIVEQNCLVNRQQLLAALQLEHNLVFNQQVDSVSAVQLYSFVRHRNGFLPFESNAPQMQLVTEGHLIRVLQKTRAQGTMYLECRV